MPDDTTNPHGYPETPAGPVHADVRFDKSDVSPGSLVFFGIWFVVILAIFHVLLWAMYRGLEKREEASQPPVPPVAANRPQFPHDLETFNKNPRTQETLFPALQVQEIRDMEDLRREENAALGKMRLDEMMRILSDAKTAAAKGIKFGEKKGEK
jgi:hypothetical protein